MSQLAISPASTAEVNQSRRSGCDFLAQTLVSASSIYRT